MRIRLIAFGILLFAGFIITKLYWLQVIDAKLYKDRADRQYSSPYTNVFDRGSIYFNSRDGERVIAGGIREGAVLSINPKLIESSTTDAVDRLYDKLNSITDLDKATFIEKVAKKQDPYEEIKRKIDKDQASQIENLKIPGISLYKDRWRVYPGDNLASQSLGLLGYGPDDSEFAGRYGIEREYEGVLSRTQQTGYKNFFAELFAGLKNAGNKKDQGDVVLTIEPTVQLTLEKELVEIQKRWNSDEIGAIIMDPHTGAIFAMSAKPDFNPNDLKVIKDIKVLSNPLVSSAYEMGSIVKPLTMAAGIDSGAVTPKTQYLDKGTLEFDGKKISNYDGKGRGQVDMQEVLSSSLNTGAAFVVGQMGRDAFSNYMYNYGLGEKTGIDLPSEQKSIVDNLKSPRDIEHMTASFGQGIATTPIATIRALATLANGGKLVTPHVGLRIDHLIGEPTILNPTNQAVGQSSDASIRQVIKDSSAKQVTDMLVTVVDKALAHGTLKLDRWSIAAKTGTAQIADHVNGGYYDDKFLHSFFGYFPAYDPKFIIFMYHINPKGAQFASETLSIPFIDLAKFLITYYHVVPDR